MEGVTTADDFFFNQIEAEMLAIIDEEAGDPPVVHQRLQAAVWDKNCWYGWKYLVARPLRWAWARMSESTHLCPARHGGESTVLRKHLKS